MRVIEDIAMWRALRATWGNATGIGFIPTMGYLHAGHLSLVKAARQANAIVAASIFVNPMQFGPSEDLSSYPRALSRDLTMLEAAGVDAIFAPTPEAMYPTGFASAVTLSGSIVERLEGARRPGHFAGVATVVTKLLNIVQPTHVYFGQKDAQQVAVVRRFVADLDLPTQVIVCPIVREADGLAMSSRNVYLTPDERQAALVLRRALIAAQEAIAGGERDAETIRQRMASIIAQEPLATLDYADVVHPDTFAQMTIVEPPALLPIVARVGKPRLLDNFLWHTDDSWDVGVSAEAE